MTVIATRVICKQPGRYLGWPTIARTPSNELLVAFSGDRDEHECPFGKIQMIRSADNGETWTEAVTIVDSPLDNRGAGLLALRDGTLTVNFNTWLCSPDQTPWYPTQVRERWKAHVAGITEAERQRWIGPIKMDYGENRAGHWVIRSTDNGQTWEQSTSVFALSAHGPAELADGRLLHLGNDGYDRIKHATRMVAEESTDRGATWQVIGSIPMFPSHPAAMNNAYLAEPHLVETEPGRILAMFRYEEHPYREEGERKFLWQAESADAGHTWTEPAPTPIWGYPPHLLKLSDGRLLVTYGHRRSPFGERACISDDGGRTWDCDDEIVLVDDAPNNDLGYPASVQLADGSMLTVYYQVDQPGEKPCLMLTHWRQG